MSTHDLPVNKVGRIYPLDVLRKAIEDAQPRIKAGRMIGEINPPGDGRSRISHASHIVRDMRVESDGSVVASVEFVDSPAGRTALEMVTQGLPMSGALRGTGAVTNGVVGNMTLSGVDITLFEPESPPSAVDQLADIVAEDEEDEEE